MFNLPLIHSRKTRSRDLLSINLVVFTVFVLTASIGCMPEGGGGGGGDGSVGPSVQGKLNLPSRLVLDYDTNDPNNNPVSNNSFNNAQTSDNLVTVVGFAGTNIPDDPQGNPHPDDAADFFQFYFRDNSDLSLRIANPDQADLDLLVYDSSTILQYSSQTSNAVENVTVITGGTYFVKVAAPGSSPNYSIYNMAVGVSQSGASAPPPEQGEFVIGEAIVKFKKETSFSAQHIKSMATEKASAMGADLQSVDGRGLALLRTKKDAAPLKGLSGRSGARLQAASSQDVKAAREETLAWIKTLNEDPAVAYAEPNYIYQPTAVTPNDSYFNLQWDKPAMHCGGAWETTKGNSDIVVAVIDSGVVYDHPDLRDNILKDGSKVVGYDMIGDAAMARDGDGRDDNPYDVGDLGYQGQTSSFHGTHVSGIASAETDNSSGIAGTSWNTKIMPVRVLGEGGGTSYDVAQGILYAAGLSNVSGTLPQVGSTVVKAHIINMSLGGASPSTTIESAISAARSAGSIVIVSAGNEATSAPYYPVAYSGVVGVSATDYLGNPAWYSNYGSYVDVAAPGGDVTRDYNNDGYEDGILSTLADDSNCDPDTEIEGPKGCVDWTYEFYDGTSMAAPNVAGVVSLMIAAYNDESPGTAFSPDDFDALLEGTAGDSIGSITSYSKGQWDQLKGHGIIDADKAVEAAGLYGGGTVDPSPRLVADPNALSFGFDLSRLEVYVANRGTNTLTGLTVGTYEGSTTWLSHNMPGTTAIAGNSTVTISFDVDRSKTDANGNYSSTVTIDSANGGSDTVKINMSVGDQVGSNAGVVYVVLINVDTKETLSQDVTSFGDGYEYAVPVTEGGTYYLAAGTDLDDDYSLGDNGELFGMYPNIQVPAELHLSAGKIVTGKDFSLQFMGLPVSSGKPAAVSGIPEMRTARRLR